MYRKIIIILIAVFTLGSMSTAFAAQEVDITITPISNFVAPEAKKDPRPVTMKEFFTQYCNAVGYGIPEVFRQIPLRMPGVKREDTLYNALQKCVYLGFVANSAVNYKWTAPVTARFVNIFVSKTLKMDPDVNEDEINLNRVDFDNLIDSVPNYKMLMSVANLTSWGADANYRSDLIRAQGFDVLSQIYQSLKADYWNEEKVRDQDLINGAIK